MTGVGWRSAGCAAASVAALTAAGAAPEGTSAPSPCAQPRVGAAQAARTMRALRAREDVWGRQLLRSPEGPTYEGARRFLPPLLYARAPGKRPLTRSGVHYAAFGHPAGARGTSAVALHVADGSEVVADRIGGRALRVSVGGRPYGSCLPRLATPQLADGWLPILQSAYADTRARYAQESFSARVGGSLVTFVRLDVTAPRPVAVRIGNVHATVTGARALHVSWRPPARAVAINAATYDAARRSLVSFWERRLAQGASIAVPERHVQDALRNLLVQNLTYTWRYSVGNPYEQFSFPEGVDVGQVMASYGFDDVSGSILRTSLTRSDARYPSWKMGQKLVGFALHHRLFRDRAHLAGATPTLARYVRSLARQLGGRDLLARERYSSDIPDSVYGLHSQAVAWQGLAELAHAWRETGRRDLARLAASTAARLERGLRRAVAASQRRLPDGSLFLPARLLDGERPYGSLTEARLGSYWNLVVPYALASGLFAPGGPQAEGALRYLLRHGSRLLGLVRAGAYALYRDPVHPVSGTDHVYGINVARFLAANDEPDQLVLSLYGHLAAGMTPGTFVSGEAASVAPLGGAYFRSMYLPPNGASNAAFLETLRVMLVHERGRGLELAFATPRAWLRPGAEIAVRALPTSFGPVSYSLRPRDGVVAATVEVPARTPPRTLNLRLRLPRGQRILATSLGRVRGDTIDLSGLRGTLELEVRVG